MLYLPALRLRFSPHRQPSSIQANDRTLFLKRIAATGTAAHVRSTPQDKTDTGAVAARTPTMNVPVKATALQRLCHPSVRNGRLHKFLPRSRVAESQVKPQSGGSGVSNNGAVAALPGKFLCKRDELRADTPFLATQEAPPLGASARWKHREVAAATQRRGVSRRSRQDENIPSHQQDQRR